MITDNFKKDIDKKEKLLKETMCNVVIDEYQKKIEE